MSNLPVQVQSFTLYGAGGVIGDTSLVLTAFTQIDGTPLTMSNFGDIGYATIEPNATSEEQVSFTGVTQNSNGTATLTGISSVGFISPFTSTTGLAQTHAGGVTFVISNTSAFYQGFLKASDNVTITGDFDFSTTPQIDNAPVNPTDAANKDYVDNVAVSGAPDASTSTKGLVQEATTAQVNAGTDTGSTGAKLFASPADIAASIYGLQLPSAGEKDALVGTSGTPGSGNKYVTDADVAAAATANKVARRNSTGDVTVNTTPTASTDAASKAYADTKYSTFGTWSVNLNANADGAGHQVATDGFLVGYIHSTSSTDTDTDIKSDSSATPTTLRQRLLMNQDNNSNMSMPFFLPVKKNDYYLIALGTAVSCPALYFLPIQ